MASYVIINGKKYTSQSAHNVFENNYNEELDKHFNDPTSSIDAKYTEHIKYLNEVLAKAEYKAGRPKAQESQPGAC